MGSAINAADQIQRSLDLPAQAFSYLPHLQRRRELADTDVHVHYFAPRATSTALNSKPVEDLNAELGNAVDDADYAQFLCDRHRCAQALPYLEKAAKAPPRPGREIADRGRHREVVELMAKARNDVARID